MVVSVNRDGRIFVDQTPVSYKDFRVTFRSLVATRKPQGVYLQADTRVPYGQVVRVLAVIRGAGIQNVGLVAAEEELAVNVRTPTAGARPARRSGSSARCWSTRRGGLAVQPGEAARRPVPPAYAVELLAAPAPAPKQRARARGGARRRRVEKPAPVKPPPKPKPTKAPAAARRPKPPPDRTETASRRRKTAGAGDAGAGRDAQHRHRRRDDQDAGTAVSVSGIPAEHRDPGLPRLGPRSRRAQNSFAEISFLILRDGTVRDIRFVTRSGSFSFDLGAQGAIEAAGNARGFGPLPDGWDADVLPVSFYFKPTSR